VVPSCIPSKSPWLLPATAILSVVLLVVASCEGDKATRPDFTGDSPYTIQTMQVSQNSLSPGDTTLVSARVVGSDHTTPAPGQEVRFGEAADKHSGSYVATAVVTDELGWAHTFFVADAGASGTATLKASVGNESAYASVSLVGAGGDGLVLTISSPTGATALIADGVSVLPLRLTAREGLAHQPVAGLAVRMVAGDRFTDRNGDGVFGAGDVLISSGDSNGNGVWDPMGSVPATVMTDGAGNADFMLHGSTATGTTWVRATAEGTFTDVPIQFHPTALKVVLQRPSARELLSDGISTTQIVAQVSDYVDNPIQGVIVRFTAGEPFEDVDEDGEYTEGRDSYTDWNDNNRWDVRGTIDSYTASDADGMAAVSYTAGYEPGEVRIRATVTGGSAETSLWLVTVPTAARIELDGERTAVFADGRSPVQGTLRVWDVNGTPLPGKQVKLVAGEPFDDQNHDGRFTRGTDVLLEDYDGDQTWTPIGTISPSVFTSGDGSATFTYNAGLIPGVVSIKATADQASNDLPIVLRSLPSVAAVTVVSDLSEIQVRGGGGVDNVLITATCFDALGDTIPSGMPVSFTVMEGPRSGEELVDAQDGIYRTRTEDAGQARAVLVSGTAPGIIEVVVTAGVVTRSVQVGVASGVASGVQLDAVDKILDFWSETEVVAFVNDRYGNPVRDGVVVLFSVDEGMVEGDQGLASSETRRGQAKATYHSLGPSLDTDFSATIRAQVQGLTAAGTLEIQINETPPPPVAILELTTDRSRIEVRRPDAAQSTEVVARGFTLEGSPVGAGYPVEMWIESGPKGGESLDGHGWGPITALTNQDGIAQAILDAGTLPGPIRVQAQSGTAVIVTVEVQVTAGPPSEMVCFGNPDEIESNQTSEILAYLYDDYHNPVQDGVLVSFQVDEGMVSGLDGPGSSRTVRGVATATYHSLTPRPGGDGVATISCIAEGGALTCETHVRIPVLAGGLSTLSLTSSEPSLIVNGGTGIHQTTLRVIGRGPSGSPVGAGYPVQVEILAAPDGGESVGGVVGGPFSDATDEAGEASTVLRAGTSSGLVRVAVRYGEIWSNTVSIPILAGEAHSMVCWPGRAAIAADDTTSVHVVVRDINENPVPDSTIVTFSVDEGKVNGDAYPGAVFSYTIGGYARGVYRSFSDTPGGDGWAVINSAVQGGVDCDTRIAIPSSEQEPFALSLYAENLEIGVHGTGAREQTVLVGTPRDRLGGTLGSGVNVVFTITNGPGGGEQLNGQGGTATALTGADGAARAILTSGTRSGTVTVGATAGTDASNSTVVAIAAGPPAYLSCVAPDSMECDGFTTTGQVRAYVTDMHRNPVRDGTVVWFSASIGLIFGAEGLGSSTTENGISYAYYYGPLGTECASWTESTLTFECMGLTCTSVVYKLATAP
jgi:hypothetical protein